MDTKHKISGWWKLTWSLLGVVGILILLWQLPNIWKTLSGSTTLASFGKSVWTTLSSSVSLIAYSMGIALLVYIPYFYVFDLPPILNKLADQNRFITKREENTWIPVENSGQFEKGVLVCHGKKLTDRFRDARIEDTTSTEHHSWLSHRGFEWLGIHSPGITNTGSLTIVVTRVKQSLSVGVPVEKCVIEEPKTIRNLRIEFPLFVLVEEIELPDGVLATFLLRAQIKIISPGKFWYGQNGKSFESLIVAIRDKTNRIVEEHDLVEFLLGDGHAQVKDELRNPDLNVGNTLGAEAVRIDIDSWSHNASKEYLAQINAKATIGAKMEASKATLDMRGKIAATEIEVLNKETEREEARKKMEEKKALATKAQGGGDSLMEQAALEISITGTEGRSERLKYQALEKTGITVLGDMSLGGFFGANNPRTKDDKEKKGEDKK